MTLVLKIDLDMVKILYHTKNEVSMSKHSKVIAQTDRHTDRQTHRQYENITFTHTQAVIIHPYLRLGEISPSRHKRNEEKISKDINFTFQCTCIIS